MLIKLLNNPVQHGDAGSPILLAVGQEHDTVRLVVQNRGAPHSRQEHFRSSAIP